MTRADALREETRNRRGILIRNLRRVRMAATLALGELAEGDEHVSVAALKVATDNVIDAHTIWRAALLAELEHANPTRLTGGP
jgi:hypothetical protein